MVHKNIWVKQWMYNTPSTPSTYNTPSTPSTYNTPSTPSTYNTVLSCRYMCIYAIIEI